MKVRIKSSDEIKKIYESNGIIIEGSILKIPYIEEQDVIEEYTWKDFVEFSNNGNIVECDKVKFKDMEGYVDDVWWGHFKNNWYELKESKNGREFFPGEVCDDLLKEKLDKILN